MRIAPPALHAAVGKPLIDNLGVKLLAGVDVTQENGPGALDARAAAPMHLAAWIGRRIGAWPLFGLSAGAACLIGPGGPGPVHVLSFVASHHNHLRSP